MKKVLSVLLFISLLFSSFCLADVPDEEYSSVKNEFLENADRSIIITIADPIVAVGKTLKLTTEITRLLDSAPAKTVLEWSSSDTSIAKVNNKGIVTGLVPGQVTISCSIKDNPEIKTDCILKVIQPVKTIKTKNRQLVLFETGDTNMDVTITPSDATNKTIKYTSDDTSIATITDTGKISAWAPGKTKVHATTTDESNKSCTCVIIVEPYLPVYIGSIAFGLYANNMLALFATNKCSTMTIVDFDFDLKFYSYTGELINGGNYSLGKEVKIRPGKEKAIRRTIFGADLAYKTEITITGVKFSDGSYWSVPELLQSTWTYTQE